MKYVGFGSWNILINWSSKKTCLFWKIETVHFGNLKIYSGVRYFWKIPYLICFLLHNILFRAVFLFTGQKRITFYCRHFKNFDQNKKNRKLYFAFNSVIKIVKSFIIKKTSKIVESLIGKGWFSPIENWDLIFKFLRWVFEFRSLCLKWISIFFTNWIFIPICAVKKKSLQKKDSFLNNLIRLVTRPGLRSLDNVQTERSNREN